jgi:hypothetical protein
LSPLVCVQLICLPPFTVFLKPCISLSRQPSGRRGAPLQPLYREF